MQPLGLGPRVVQGRAVRAQVCLKGTLFTPLSAHNTSTQSLNVQLRKELDLHVNLVHGFNIAGVPSRFSDVDVVVIRCGLSGPLQGFIPHDVQPGAWL